MKKEAPKTPKSLDPEDIEEVPQVNRRSALASVGALLAGAVFGAGVLAPSEAEACRRRTGRTDRDPSDGVGRGHTGLTDGDSGDEAGCGRGRRVRRRRCTDSDPRDRPGRGVNC
ncbi:MAG: hypothetical protein HY909_26415 [Deltaproteobacteria bacterium]|nr:hypothetical protein [Deltaproteobacteria bacterium]